MAIPPWKNNPNYEDDFCLDSSMEKQVTVEMGDNDPITPTPDFSPYNIKYRVLKDDDKLALYLESSLDKNIFKIEIPDNLMNKAMVCNLINVSNNDDGEIMFTMTRSSSGKNIPVYEKIGNNEWQDCAEKMKSGASTKQEEKAQLHPSIFSSQKGY